MAKKVILGLLTVVMLFSFVGCEEKEPEPQGFAASMFFDADFSKETVADATGTATAEECASVPVTFEEDAELKKKVGVFKGTAVKYNNVNTHENMDDAFTMEAYVKLEKQSGYGLICGTYWFNSKTGVGIGVGTFTLNNDTVGYNRKISMFVGDGSLTKTVRGGAFGEWLHLVFVHDGEKDYYYVNGEDMTEGGVASTKIMKHDGAGGFRIGGYTTVPQFAVNDMRISYVRLYNEAATADDIKTLYEGRNA